MYCINYVIKQGDTLYSISRHFNISVDMLFNANPLINVYNLQIGDVICVPVSVPQNSYEDYTTYLIEEGDSLGGVLRRYRMNLADFMEQNDLNSILLQPGATLQVPIMEESDSEVTF